MQYQAVNMTHTPKGRSRRRTITPEDKSVLTAVEALRNEFIQAHKKLSAATDEELIDCFIYELKAVQLKYSYYIRVCKEKGLRLAETM